MRRQPLFRFGIASLDRLLSKEGDADASGFGYPLSSSTTLCLIGPSGTGKSVLGLHLACRYFADLVRSGPNTARVFYISTDLTFETAALLWQDFGLDCPAKRIRPFEYPNTDARDAQNVELKKILPYRDAPVGHNLAELLAGQEEREGVNFIDLASASAGDDWGFVQRLIAALEGPESDAQLHLIVVDAIDGLETLVGEHDAFGERTSRRGRIAQLLRTASQKCHLLLLTEAADGGLQPEEFISDVVIRLRTVREYGYDRRTVEIQKARGQSHIRGQHPYFIRKGTGSTTGQSPNYDDPMVSPQTKPGRHQACQAYVIVLPSIHSTTRRIMEKPGSARPMPNQGVAEFGIANLDSMLRKSQEDPETFGLPVSTVTALIGDAGTHKSALGKSFLFKSLKVTIIDLLEKHLAQRPWSRPLIPPVVLLTTSDIDAKGLARLFLYWACLENQQKPRAGELLQRLRDPQANSRKLNSLLAKVEDLVICRRFEVHNQISEVVMHIVRSAVEEAQERLRLTPEDPTEKRYEKSQGIRLVIDDLGVLRNMYPLVKNDALFLPYLIFHLKREGISTLIVETRAGQPDRPGPPLMDDELRALADNHLYTWPISFRGESKIAISAIPPLNPSDRSTVRELRCDSTSYLAPLPTVDRELELYTGIEQGNPTPVPLEVRLYAETELFGDYIADMKKVLGDFFFLPAGASDIVVATDSKSYAYLHDFCNLQGGSALDHTLILQVDEFWSVTTHPSGFSDDRSPLRRESHYLSAPLDDPDVEPRNMFQGLRSPSANDAGNVGDLGESVKRENRALYFRVPACPLVEEKTSRVFDEVDRIPFMWEFGFLLCRKAAWLDAKSDKVPGVRGRNGEHFTVGQILERLPRTEGHLENEVTTHLPIPATSGRASWREFLGACQTVAGRVKYSGQRPIAFDISRISGESFSCLILEIWASEIADRLNATSAENLVRQLSKKYWQCDETSQGLAEWLDNPKHVIDLYLAWLLLVDVLPLQEFVGDSPGPIHFEEHSARSNAVASRHWYKTACELLRKREDHEEMYAVGLPGRFSMRGDWFLGVARGSKSDLVADRALDLFSSRRNNFARLYAGIGLPTRILGNREQESAFRTALSWGNTPLDLRTVRYEELAALGAMPSNDKKLRVGKGFYWLWRSSLKNYHKHSRILQHWNCRSLLAWKVFKAEAGPDWVSGFEIYDYVKGLRRQPATFRELEDALNQLLKKPLPNSWTLFQKRCELLKDLIARSDRTQLADETHLSAY